MNTVQLKLFYSILDTREHWGPEEIKSIFSDVVTGKRTQV